MDFLTAPVLILLVLLTLSPLQQQKFSRRVIGTLLPPDIYGLLKRYPSGVRSTVHLSRFVTRDIAERGGQ